MSISLNQPHSSPGNFSAPARPEPEAAPWWLVLFFWSVVALLLAAAVAMRLYHLDLPFDRDSYDEGVYWQSLRAMLAGQSLYKTIFYSQPPLFLLSTYPGFAFFGGNLWSARFGIVLVSLLGFPGAYLLGRALAGRLGALAAMLLLLADPFYLAQSQTIQAEASSVAFTFLAVAFAFLWWKRPDGWQGMCWAALCGLTFSLSVLCKLLCVSTIVPIALLMLTRAWHILRREPGTSGKSWLPMLLGIGVAVLTALAGVAPFLGSFKEFWAGVVTFHTAASLVVATPHQTNQQLILTALTSVTTLAAMYGSLAALLRRDWRVLPVLAWLLVTLALLYRWKPLFTHHLIALEPPLITLALLGLAESAAYKVTFGRLRRLGSALGLIISLGAMLLVLVAAGASFWQDVNYYQGDAVYAAGTIVQQNVRVANDLRQAIAPDQWVITDGQFIAGLADRSTPPSLVDTSTVRIQTGYVTLAQLEQAALDPRVHAVLFYTGRFHTHQVAGFHAWVAAHFHLLHKYNNRGQELWVR
jgi:4-amino-4-deoxy-L-arabinose transferase-like glycosyltransferase